MPTPEDPFDEVLTVPKWKEKREQTGQHGNLTTKVSLSDEFKRFHKSKTVEAARFLLGKLEIYEQQLRKHNKEKFFTRLNQLIQGQIQAVQGGLALIEQLARDAEQQQQAEQEREANRTRRVAARRCVNPLDVQLKTIKSNYQRQAVDHDSLMRTKKEIEALEDSIREMVERFQGDVQVSEGDVQEAERFKNFTKGKLDEMARRLEEEAKQEPFGTEEEGWEYYGQLGVETVLSQCLAKYDDVVLAVSVDTLLKGPLASVRKYHKDNFTLENSSEDRNDPEKWKDTNSPLIKEMKKLAEVLLKQEIDAVHSTQQDSRWFKYEKPAPKKEKTKKVALSEDAKPEDGGNKPRRKR